MPRELDANVHRSHLRIHPLHRRPHRAALLHASPSPALRVLREDPRLLGCIVETGQHDSRPVHACLRRAASLRRRVQRLPRLHVRARDVVRESLEHEGLARVDVPEVASNVADDAFVKLDAKNLFGAR